MLEVAEKDTMTRVTAQVAEKVNLLTEQAQLRSEDADRDGWFSQHFDKKSQWSNWTVLAMLVLCCLTLIQYRSFSGVRFGRSAAAGSPLSALELTSLDNRGRSVTLADLRGQVALIHFWEPESELSQDTLSRLVSIERQFSSEPGFRLMAVSCGRRPPQYASVLREQTETAFKKFHIRLPAYADPGMVTRKAVGLRGCPATAALDRQGRIRQIWRDVRPETTEEIRQLLTKLLKDTQSLSPG